MSPARAHRHLPRHMLHLFTRLVVLSTLILILAGGLVTSTGSGLVVPGPSNTCGPLEPVAV